MVPVESSLPKKPVTERGCNETTSGLDVPETDTVTRSPGSSLSTEEKLLRGTGKSLRVAEKSARGGFAGSMAETVAVPSSVPVLMPKARIAG